MHYTSIENIHKVIDPLFLNDLTAEYKQIEEMTNSEDKAKRASDFIDKISKLSFLDIKVMKMIQARNNEYAKMVA